MLNNGEGWDAIVMNSYSKLMLDFHTKFSLRHRYRRRMASTLKRVTVFFLFGTLRGIQRTRNPFNCKFALYLYPPLCFEV